MHDGHEGHAGHHHHHHDLEATSASREEAVALLGYMVAHNEHHAEELTELAENMRGWVWRMLRKRLKTAWQTLRKVI